MKLEDVIEEWLIFQWSKDTKGEIRRRNQRMTNNSMDKDTKGEIRRRNQRMIDNAIGKRYQRGKLEDVIKEWLIIQWSKDTKGKLEDVIKEWLIT